MDAVSAEGGGTVILDSPVSILCQSVARNGKNFGLEVPPGVELDLNGRELWLSLSGVSYGVVLQSNTAIRNGRIAVIESKSPGLQGIWHAALSVGAAYGDGGTVDAPDPMSKVSGFVVEDMRLAQLARPSGVIVSIMSEAHNGAFRNIVLEDSQFARVGIALDWGTVCDKDEKGKDKIRVEPELIGESRKEFDKGRAYTTHPHHITFDRIIAGRILGPSASDDALYGGGVLRMSAVDHIAVRDMHVTESRHAAVMTVAGDLGYELARPEDAARAHQAISIEDITCDRCNTYGFVAWGLADNVQRAVTQHGYQPRMPTRGTFDLRVLRGFWRGAANLSSPAGIITRDIDGMTVEGADIEGFAVGIQVDENTNNSTFWRSNIHHNLTHGIAVGKADGTVPSNISLATNRIYNNGVYQNGAPSSPWAAIHIDRSNVVDVVGNDIGAPDGPEYQKCGIQRTAGATTLRMSDNRIHSWPSYGAATCGF